jgi:hypothetical protein
LTVLGTTLAATGIVPNPNPDMTCTNVRVYADKSS